MKWLPLFLTNFLGIFNDNLLKHLAIFVGVGWVIKENQPMMISLASAMLFIPFLLFSPYAGRLAKRYSKVQVMRYTKLAEIPIMAIAALGFFFENIPLVLTGIFLMGLQSALYSPSKHGLIRDIGGYEGLSFGTGVLEMLTFLGILAATVLASSLSDHYHFTVAGILFLSIAMAGYLSSLFITAKEPPVDRSDDTINPILFIKESFRYARTIHGLNPVVFATSFFWLIASLIQLNLISYCPEVLKLSNTHTGYVMATAAVGIALGCYAAGVLSRHKVDLRWVSIGTVGLLTSIAIVVIFSPRLYLFVTLIFLAAFSCGLYKIPLGAWIQEHVPGRMLGEMIAYGNLMDFIFILVSAGIYGFLASMGGSVLVFQTILLLAVLMSVFAAWKVPQFFTSWKK